MVRGKIIDSRAWMDIFWKASWARIDDITEVPDAGEARAEFFVLAPDSMMLALNSLFIKRGSSLRTMDEFKSIDYEVIRVGGPRV